MQAIQNPENQPTKLDADQLLTIKGGGGGLVDDIVLSVNPDEEEQP